MNPCHTYFYLRSSRRYGFPNQEALNAGKAGTDCRGEEHDVTFVWSITSGKRMLMSNGQHLHVSTNKSKSFEYTWHDKNGNHLKVVAHSTQPLSNVGTVRQYDLFINGRSFFTLPKVYEVGLKTTNTENRVPGVITSSDRQRLDAESPTRRSVTYSASGRNVVAPSTASQVSLFCNFCFRRKNSISRNNEQYVGGK